MPVSKRPRSAPLTKTDLTEALERVVTIFDARLTETRLQLERKIDWSKQDAKEQLEAVDRRLGARINEVDQRLSGQIAAVYGVVKEVHDRLLATLQTPA